MYCINCGKEIEENSVFCQYCGEKCIKENKKKGRKSSTFIITLGIVAIFLGMFVGINSIKDLKDKSKEAKGNNVEYKQEEQEYKTTISIQEEEKVEDLQKEDTISSSEKELFQLRNRELEEVMPEYANLSVEPTMYIGTVCEGYSSESNECIDDVYYLWLKKTEDVEYVSANGEVKTIATKGLILESENLDPLVGEEVVCYGKAVESSYNEIDVSFLPAVILPQQREVKDCSYMDRPNSVDNLKSEIQENTISSYKNMLSPNPVKREEIAFQYTLEQEYGTPDNTVELYGGYMLEDLDNDDVPELILPGMLNNYCVLFIINPALEISVVPGEFLYNVPGENLFYTAEGYDDYIFYACWYRGRHSGIYGNKAQESFTYMKAFENGRDTEGNYVGYDYSNVILGQNVMREKSYDISNKLDELFNQVEIPMNYDYTDLSPFDNY